MGISPAQEVPREEPGVSPEHPHRRMKTNGASVPRYGDSPVPQPQASGQGRARQRREGGRGSYQTSRCRSSAVHLRWLPSPGRSTPWCPSRCQKARDVFSAMQTFSIIISGAGICASWRFCPSLYSKLKTQGGSDQLGAQTSALPVQSIVML